KQSAYDKSAYPETEIFAGLHERRWQSGEGLDSTPALNPMTGNPNGNMVAKVYNLYAMNHPDVAKAAAAHLLEMAKHAQQNDQIRAVDVEYLEACLELCSNM